MKRLIKRHFPDDYYRAVKVARCESGLRITARNDKNVTPTIDRGIFQINSVHDAKLEAHGLDPWKPTDNVKFARILYDQSGWVPWVCWWHKDHLAMGR